MKLEPRRSPSFGSDFTPDDDLVDREFSQHALLVMEDVSVAEVMKGRDFSAPPLTAIAVAGSLPKALAQSGRAADF